MSNRTAPTIRFMTLKLFFKALQKRKIAAVGFGILMLYIFAAFLVIVGIVPPTPQSKVGWENMYLPPSLKDFPWYIVGTDYAGRPVFLLIVRGIPDSLTVALITAIITVGVGIAVGLTAGYIGGIVDGVLSVLVDVALNIPSSLLMLILAATLPVDIKRNYFVVGVIISATAWAGLARAVRAQVLSLKRREFIDVARALGFSSFRIIFREIMPLLGPFIFRTMIGSIISGIGAYNGLAFLGFLPLRPENWGLQLSMAVQSGALYTGRGIYAWMAPIIAMAGLQISLNYIARLGEDLFSPALRAEILSEEELK